MSAQDMKDTLIHPAFDIIFSTLLELFKIIVIVNKIINELKLKTKLKLFLMNTPIIKIENIDRVKKISGSNIFKLFIILI